MNDLTPTGLLLLDENLGGFHAGRSYLAFGEAGSGKSLLGLQYLKAGVDRAETGLLLTFERPEDLLAQAESFGFRLEAPLRDGRFVVLEYDQDITSRMLRYGWKNFLTKLQVFVREHHVRRMVFDPVHPLFAGHTEEGRLRYDLRYFCETLEEWGVTTLFLIDRGALQGHPSLYRVFSEICSGLFELQSESESSTQTRHLFVHKIRSATGPRRRIPFRIEPGVGLVGADSAPSAVVDPGTPKHTGMPAVASKQTVLVVDDDPFIRKLLATGLGSEFHVVFATDGVEALTLAIKEHPDVIALDVVMPKINGFEVCRALREGGFDRPILFISGDATEPSERVRGLMLGANDYIQKPFVLAEVVEKIRMASHYRVNALPHPASAEAQSLDRLIERAVDRSLDRDTFYSRVGTACEQAARYQVPLSLVRLTWAASERQPWIRRTLQEATRPEDAFTIRDANSCLVLLHLEGRSGARAYLQSVASRMETDMASGIEAASTTYSPTEQEAWRLEDALRHLDEAVLHPLEELRAGVEPGTGTDG